MPADSKTGIGGTKGELLGKRGVCRGKESHILKDPKDLESIQVDDKIYSASKLAAVHPGGEVFVKSFAGRDASEAFISYHRRKFPHQKMENCLIGTATPLKSELDDQDFLELCSLVEKVVPNHKAFAPPSYFVKCFLILAFTFSLEIYMHYTKRYVWYLSAILGFMMAQIGLNIQHDANHGAISRNPTVNRLLGLSQNWIGGAAVDWIHQHVVQHHIHCNDIHNDPDLAGNVALRINPLHPLLKIHVLQHLYLFLMIAIFGFSVIITSFQHIISGVHYTKFSKMLDSTRKLEGLISALFPIRWIVLPLIRSPNLLTFLNIAPMFVVGGYYLAFFFIISHNFDGVYMFDTSKNSPQKSSFLYTQVASSSNVGGEWLCMLNGGLNFQIEHHLFPRMNHSHYPKIAPIVRTYCEKKGIPYRHFPTISENVYSCIKHLYDLGHHQSVKNIL